MGIPRFGELIRRRYPDCWFKEGSSQVLTKTPGELDLSTRDYRKKRQVDTLYVDGNGLLHPAMQYTFAYGSFEDTARQKENMSKSDDQLIEEGTNAFLGAIESLCLEFHPQRLVIAIDGSAPVAKMIQQRQRRFGAKMDVTNDPALNQAWEATLRRSVQNSLQEEGAFVSVTIEFDAGRRDFGEGLISTRLELLQTGSPQEQIFRGLIEKLVKGKGQAEKIRWYNVLSPETPLGFEYDGKYWYSVAMAASALAWKEVWKQNTYISLFGMEDEPDIGVNSNNKYIHGTGKITTSEESPVYRAIEEFRRFRISNQDFLIKYSSKVAEYCEKIGDHLADTYPMYRDVLLLTGVGTNLERLDGKRIDWLMNVRTKLIQRLEKELAERSTPPERSLPNEVEYPEYENGFRGAEGVMDITKFDSNSLTPGTHVMNLIDRNIQGRIKEGFMEFSDGTRVETLYSSHRIPGEGEHKLENLIDREERDMTGKVSLVYGLDADLFMLSLVRDHPVCLVRENNFKVEKFLGKIPKSRMPRHASCHVVDIQTLKRLLQEDRSINALDFTLICFMFGNDFLRNIPGMVFDGKAQVIFDNQRTRDDEDVNPYLFDFIFDIYVRVRTQHNVRPDLPLFISSSRGDLLKIQWIRFYDFLSELSKYEKNIYGGMIRKMQQEEGREKVITERNSDYVPVSLRYHLLKKAIVERQVIKGGVIDQKAVWIRGIDAFDMEEFKKLWTAHISNQIPGFDVNGVVPGLVKDKSNVIEEICQSYLEGMEWAMRYYTNRHSFVDRNGSRKSILNTRWYYPYFHAPMLSQLKNHLWKFILEDSRDLFSLTPSMDLQQRLQVLFSPLTGKEITSEIKYSFPKTEKDILDILPSNYFVSPQPLNDVVKSQIADYIRMLDQKPPSESYQLKRTAEQLGGRNRDVTYLSENTFSSGWSVPRTLYGFDDDNLLVAPSTTNAKVQLLAVLPPQSMKYFPEGIVPSNQMISWLFPKGIPVDFTFRDRVHAATLIIPPPNIPFIETFMKMNRSISASDQIRQGMFPRDIVDPKITPMALKKSSYYVSINDILEEHVVKLLPREPVCVDVFAGVGISSFALDNLRGKVYAFEPNRENFSDLVHNIKRVRNDITPINDYFNFSPDNFPDLFFLDLPYERRRDNKDIRIQTHPSDRFGTHVEEFIEDMIREFSERSNETLTIVIKLPSYGFLKRINTTERLKTKFVKDVVHDTPITYAIISVSRNERRTERPREGYDYYSYPREQYDRPASPDYGPKYDYNDAPNTLDYAVRGYEAPASPEYYEKEEL